MASQVFTFYPLTSLIGLPYTIAKRWLRLPYHPAHIAIQQKEQTYHFESNRKSNVNNLICCKGMYTPLRDVFVPEEGTLEYFLTERYCFFSTNNASNIYCLDIHHQPWQLQQAEIEIHFHSLFLTFHIDVSKASPICHFSIGTESLIWNIKKIIV